MVNFTNSEKRLLGKVGSHGSSCSTQGKRLHDLPVQIVKLQLRRFHRQTLTKRVLGENHKSSWLVDWRHNFARSLKLKNMCDSFLLFLIALFKASSSTKIQIMTLKLYKVEHEG